MSQQPTQNEWMGGRQANNQHIRVILAARVYAKSVPGTWWTYYFASKNMQRFQLCPTVRMYRLPGTDILVLVEPFFNH